MHTENFVVYNGSQGQVIENIGAVSPNIDRSEFPQALIIKAVHLCDLSALVIASYESYSFGVPNFQCHQKEESFH